MTEFRVWGGKDMKEDTGYLSDTFGMSLETRHSISFSQTIVTQVYVLFSIAGRSLTSQPISAVVSLHLRLDHEFERLDCTYMQLLVHPAFASLLDPMPADNFIFSQICYQIAYKGID